MPDFATEIEALDEQLDGLETALDRTTQLSSAFQTEVGFLGRSLDDAQKDAQKFSKSLSSNLKGAFGDLVFEGAKLSDVLRSVAQSMVQSTFNQAITPVTDALAGVVTNGIGNLIGGILPFEKGGAFSQGRVMPFAKGGVVSGATAFPMRGGTGLMGEAGPEAIMPLTRGADGSLGVRSAQGAAPVTVNMTINTPDAQSFQRSRSQIAAGISRAVQRGQRNF